MNFQIADCKDEDMSRFFELFSEVFEHEHPYVDATFPDHETPAGRCLGTQRMLDTKLEDEHSKFLKVIDTSSGEMIAAAKWDVYRDLIPEETELKGDYWKSQEQKDVAKYIYREFVARRKKAIRETKGNVICLDILVVQSKFQRRGVGRMLVKWGTNLADELGVGCIVESSNHSEHLYESEGFRVEERVVIDYPDKWKGLKEQEFIWMVRPPRPRN